MDSIESLASAILNDVMSGLKGPNSIPLSLDQVKDDIYTMRNRIMGERLIARVPFDAGSCYQVLENVKLEKRDLAESALGIGGKDIYWFKLPTPLLLLAGLEPVLYAGSTFKRTSLRIIQGEYSYPEHGLGTRKAPVVWFDFNDNVWLINCPKGVRDKMRFTLAVSQPRKLRELTAVTNAWELYGDDKRLAMGLDLAHAVKSQIVNDYVRRYRLGNPQTNTASDMAGNSVPPQQAES